MLLNWQMQEEENEKLQKKITELTKIVKDLSHRQV
jgi:hypothetical protein